MATSESSSVPLSGVTEALETVRRMVFPHGCAWHEVQTHESLVPFLIEESAEFVDAIERGLPSDEVAGELGDVLYQVLFHAVLAERDGEGYDLDSIGRNLANKLQARHPHVFGDRGYLSVEQLHAEWERLKEDAAGAQRGSRGVLEGIPVGMPTLARSAKVVERLKRAGLLELAGQEEVSALRARLRPGFSESIAAPGASIAVPGADPLRHTDPAEAGVQAQAQANAAESESAESEAEADTASASDTELAAEARVEGTAQAAAQAAEAEAELGDAILALVMQANRAGIDPDRALRLATNRLADTLDA